MPSKSLENTLSMKENKAILESQKDTNHPYSETGHLHQEKILLEKSKWFKGSRDRGLRGNLAA